MAGKESSKDPRGEGDGYGYRTTGIGGVLALLHRRRSGIIRSCDWAGSTEGAPVVCFTKMAASGTYADAKAVKGSLGDGLPCLNMQLAQVA